MNFGGWQRSSLLDFPGKVSLVLFTQGCPFRCPFCHNPALVIPSQFSSSVISQEEVVAFLEKRRGKLDGVVITGGEPTIHAPLPDFIRTVRSMGFAIKLDSNGSRSDVLELLLRDRLLDYVALDRKASWARYSRVAGAPVDVQSLMRSSQLVTDSTIPYEFRTTLLKEFHPTEEVEQIARELSGARRFILQQFRPTVTLDPKLQQATPYSDTEMAELVSLAAPYVRECSWR